MTLSCPLCSFLLLVLLLLNFMMSHERIWVSVHNTKLLLRNALYVFKYVVGCRLYFTTQFVLPVYRHSHRKLPSTNHKLLRILLEGAMRDSRLFVGVFCPATSRVISGWVSTCDDAHSWWLYTVAPLGDQAFRTVTWYPTNHIILTLSQLVLALS